MQPEPRSCRLTESTFGGETPPSGTTPPEAGAGGFHLDQKRKREGGGGAARERYSVMLYCRWPQPRRRFANNVQTKIPIEKRRQFSSFKKGFPRSLWQQNERGAWWPFQDWLQLTQLKTKKEKKRKLTFGVHFVKSFKNSFSSVSLPSTYWKCMAHSKSLTQRCFPQE